MNMQLSDDDVCGPSVYVKVNLCKKGVRRMSAKRICHREDERKKSLK